MVHRCGLIRPDSPHRFIGDNQGTRWGTKCRGLDLLNSELRCTVRVELICLTNTNERSQPRLHSRQKLGVNSGIVLTEEPASFSMTQLRKPHTHLRGVKGRDLPGVSARLKFGRVLNSYLHRDVRKRRDSCRNVEIGRHYEILDGSINGTEFQLKHICQLGEVRLGPQPIKVHLQTYTNTEFSHT